MRWDEFEVEVRNLLSLQGWKVTPEHILLHKKIDAYAEKSVDFGRRMRIAVECKRYDSRLTQDQVSRIYSNYLPLLQTDTVDEIVLVTSSGITASARTFAASAAGLVHITYLELLNSLIDFSSYLKTIRLDYEQDEASHYYVQQNYVWNSGEYGKMDSLEEAIRDWSLAQDERPVAILAGYGMGKTTFTKRIAHLLAKDHLSSPSSRIPVVIRLEELASEQSLDGLLGTHFTSRHLVPNYTFLSFLELNRRGRFVIFLDGFDEMKRTMSWEVMRYNFRQLNRLVRGQSKVVLSGRPSVFLNEGEYEEALHGRRKILGRWREIPDWPDYHEVHLQRFSREQISVFVKSYTAFMSSESQQPRLDKAEASSEAILASAEDKENSHLIGLSERPVQLKMLMEILPDWGKALDTLTATVLYSEFIDLIIRRELDKLSRISFNAKQRRDFVRELAYWMWKGQFGEIATAASMPDALFAKYARPDEALPDIKRDLLAACFIESKKPEGYYFPHRSFQEYLVAEKLCELLSTGHLDSGDEVSVTAEILDFSAELLGESGLGKLKRIIWDFRGTLPDWLPELCLRSKKSYEGLLKSPQAMISPWSFVMVAVGLRYEKWDLSRNPELLKFLERSLAEPPHRSRTSTSRKWARLLIVLNILLADIVEKLGINLSARLETLVEFARVRPRQALVRDRHGIVMSHIAEDFCCLESWRNGGMEYDRLKYDELWYRLRPEDDASIDSSR